MNNKQKNFLVNAHVVCYFVLINFQLTQKFDYILIYAIELIHQLHTKKHLKMNAITPVWHLSGSSCNISLLLGINDKCVRKFCQNITSSFNLHGVYHIAHENERVRKDRKRSVDQTKTAVKRSNADYVLTLLLNANTPETTCLQNM